MNVLDNIYYTGLAENEKNWRYWQQYLHNLRSLDFNVYADKLKVPVLVPIGSRIFFRGVIKHTNEVTAALGADYFTKCSVKQAEVLRDHRMKDVQAKVNALIKEKEYLESQLSFNKQNVDVSGHEIVEEYNEAEDKLWREKHRQNMKNYKQNKAKSNDLNETNVTDEELWERLEELELQEELESEMQNMNALEKTEVCDNSSAMIEPDNNAFVEIKKGSHHNHDHMVTTEDSSHIQDIEKSKYNLIQKVLEKQQELEEKLFELKHKERGQSKTENDLLAKLDEMEELDELEDEMDRLDNLLENGNIEDDDEEEEEAIDEKEDVKRPAKIKRSTSFADEDDSECLELTFKHSDTSPNTDSYDPKKGIIKPSDLYEAYKNNFTTTTSILKKSKYNSDITIPDGKKSVAFADTAASKDRREIQEEKKTILIKDIQEKKNDDISTLENSGRPISLFKMKRQQNKIKET